MRFLIRFIIGFIGAHLWVIPVAIVVILLGTFVFNDSWGRSCEFYCADLAIVVDGRVANQWSEAGVKWFSVHQKSGNGMAASESFKDDMSPQLVAAARIGDSVYKAWGSRNVTLVRGSHVMTFPSQEIWDSCDCQREKWK